MTWLRGTALAVAILVLAAGVAAGMVFGTPMEAVLPLRAMVAVCVVVVFCLAGAAWWLGGGRGWLPVIVAIFDMGLAAVAVVATIRAPACDDFSVTDDDVRLAGSVCVPSGGGPAPTAVLVHGSGPETRSEYRFYAEALAKGGVAAVVYDKRGAGESTGETYEGGYEAYAKDLVAVARWAAGRPFAADGKVGFVGFSEAEWVMPMAARSFTPAFIVVVGASGLSPHDQVSEEMAMRLKRAGYDAPAQQAAIETNDALARYLRKEIDAETFGAILKDAQSQPWFPVAGDLPDKVYPRSAYAWWRSVMDTDPAIWNDYDGPVLFIKGRADDRSDAGAAEERLRAVLPDPGRQLEVHIFDQADHMILRWPRGEGKLPPEFPEGYPAVIAKWVVSVASGGRKASGSS